MCFLLSTGKILGVHRGLWFHTIGQRKGLGLQLQSVVHDGPWFVAAKDADTNTVYVTNDLSVVERPRIEFRVHKMNWVSGRAPPGLRAPGGLTMDVKLRHGPTLSRATITVSDSSNPSVTPILRVGRRVTSFVWCWLRRTRVLPQVSSLLSTVAQSVLELV